MAPTFMVRNVMATRPRSSVTLDVEDEGEGMSPMVLERATRLFFTTKAQGTGLGLSFAERVARAHGGELRVTFTFPTTVGASS